MSTDSTTLPTYQPVKWLRVRGSGVAHRVLWTDLREVDFACGFGRYAEDCLPADPDDLRCRTCEPTKDEL